MKFLAYLGIVTLGLLPVAANAADIDATGAKEIENQFDRLFPLAVGSILKVSPTGDHYRALLDFAPAIEKLNGPVRISEVTPIDTVIKPRSDGLWDITAQGKDAWLIGDHFFGQQPSHFQLHFGSYDVKTAFDPIVRIPRDPKASIKDLDFSSRAYLDWITVSAKNYEVATKIGNVKNGLVDVSVDVNADDFRETRRVPEYPDEFVFHSKSLHGQASIKGENAGAVRSLMAALAQKPGSDRTKKEVQWQQLATALRNHPNVVDGFSEHGDFQFAGLSFGDIEILSDRLGFEFNVSFAPGNNVIAINLTADRSSLRPGRFAKGIDAAMPEAAGLGIELDGMDLQGAILATADQGHFKTQAEQGAAFLNAIFPKHRVRMMFDNTFARSQNYDVAIKGWLEFNPDNNKDGAMDVTITARNLDKTVAFLQANANNVPQFGQASFMVLMAKGFGKPEADGSITWNITRDRTGKVLINGRKMTH